MFDKHAVDDGLDENALADCIQELGFAGKDRTRSEMIAKNVLSGKKDANSKSLKGFYKGFFFTK